MQVLHLDLRQLNDEQAELRYFFDNPNDYRGRSLALKEIQDLLQVAERDYYTILPENFPVTGHRLYKWLDGSDRWLAGTLNRYPREGIVLAIAVAGKLAHLPWEVLHDGKGFLVDRLPAVVPVRWVSSETKRLPIKAEPENRALQVLFMATSPLGVEPVLDFEAEEGRILEATARFPLALVVEESGCLSELGYLVGTYGKGDFDILHLTGHATVTESGPRFYTETETGGPYLASATDIATVLEFRLPKLIFLSGCRTGQASKWGAVPSIAEELLKSGAKAVLGWGQKVSDFEAMAAAAALYQELSAGKELTEAVALTYQALIKNQARDWHLLRLYAAETLPGELVTPLKTKKRKPAPPLSVATQFLDPAGKVKVPTRGSFVGRRRQLQNCLRSLKPPSEMVGVLIHGMGGLGKSSLAARLCDRLPDFERVVWVGPVDEPSLVNRLKDKLDSKELRQTLQSDDEELRFRLRRVFQVLEEQGAKPFLLVLDDFEANLEPRNGGYVLQPEAASVLEALIWAIRETYSSHRLILTCRYDFEFTQLRYFYKQPLDALRGADLWKKCSRLAAFGSQFQVDEALQSQAHRLADGNPRLLEWLDKLLQNSAGREAITNVSTLSIERVSEILTQLEGKHIDLREEVLAQALIDQMEQPMREMLSDFLVFEVPVPRVALQEICTSIPNLDDCIDRAIALGVLEVSIDGSLRVPRILPLQLPGDSEALCSQAAKILYRFWRIKEREILIEEQWTEVYRLALLGKEEAIAAEISSVLSTIWDRQGQFRKAVNVCRQTLELLRKPSSPKIEILIALGNASRNLAQYQKAIDCYEQALSIFDDRDEQEPYHLEALLGNLSACYSDLGQLSQAICYSQRALGIASRYGDRESEGTLLHNLGNYYADLGQLRQALEYYQEAKGIAIDRNNRELEGRCLNNLCELYGLMGQFRSAVECGERALVIQDKVQDLVGKGETLHSLAQIQIDLENYDEAIEYAQMGVKIGEQIESPELQSDNYSAIACAQLYRSPDKLSKAWTAAKAAQQFDVPLNNHYVSLLVGIIALRQGEPEGAASDAFTVARKQSSELLHRTQQNYRALDTEWLTLCGLALCGERDCIPAAIRIHRQVRKAIEKEENEGLVKRSNRLLSNLLLADTENILVEVHKAVILGK